MSFINESASAASPAAGFPGGAGLGFMSKIVTTAFNHILQQELIEDDHKWKKEMFHMENSYNSPVAMAQRMRHAGLNPYAMTGQQVAGSFNSGSSPSPIPMEDPFDNLVKAAQIANINADTEQKHNNAEIAYQEARKKAVEADNFDEYWSLTLANLEKQGKLTDAEIETEKAKAQKEFELARKAKEDADQFVEFGNSGGNTYVDASNLSGSQTELNEANTATVDALREHLVEVQKASADSLKASANLAREQCNKTKEETEKLSDDDKKRTWDVTIGQFFGLADISVLAPELQAKAAQYYWDFQQGKYSYESTISAFQDQINRYVEKNGHIVQATSVNHSMGVKIGPISGNASSGKSGTY